MGWKNVRDHYAIEHLVHMRNGNLLVGSPYVSDLLTIEPNGRVTRNSVVGRDSKELSRIVNVIEGDRDRFVSLFEAEDSFEQSLPVYTWNDKGEIVEELCEEYGYPNVTHAGNILYENVYFADRNTAVRRALRSLKYRVESADENQEQAERELEKRRQYAQDAHAALATLRKSYPELTAAEEGEI